MPAADAAASVRNDAIGTKVVAAVLDFDIGTCAVA